MRFVVLAEASDAVAAASKRTEKVAHLASVFTQLGPDEVPPAVAFAMGQTVQGRIGVGWATLRDVRPEPAPHPELDVLDVDRTIADLATVHGSGSTARRRELIERLMARATASEQRLLAAIIGGELRQGALDGVVAAAVAKAAGVRVGDVQRGAMFAGSLPHAARFAMESGAEGLARLELTPATPVQPMLATAAADVAEAVAQTGPASVEWKLDGARVQAHRSKGEVRLFTRNLNDVTDRFQGVADIVSGLDGGDLVLDGEVLGLDAAGGPLRFQDTMGDFAADAERGRGGGLRPFFFDVLHAGSALVDEPLVVRRDALAEVVPPEHRLPSIVTADAGEAQRFFDAAIEAHHEGVMVKDLDSVYEAGRRGGSWRKVKPVYTFDLVVLAVEWGHGRRTGRLSNLHLGARSDDGSFVMVGKTFKGLTDELLRWQTDRFLDLEIGREGRVVHVRPEQVVEVAVDGVQASSRYPGGVALRFARVRRYRSDKAADAADTIERVRERLR